LISWSWKVAGTLIAMRRSVHEENASLPDFLTAERAWYLEHTVEKTGCDG
jgi:hypothetical protein